MNDEDRSLLRSAVDAAKRLAGGGNPARDGLQALIQEHGREAVVKAAADENVGAAGSGDELDGLSQQEIEQLLAEAGESKSGEASGEASGGDEPPAWFKPYAEKLDKLEGGKSEDGKAGEGDKLPEDELALVKAGVPIETIENAKELLAKGGDTRKQTLALLAKSAPKRAAGEGSLPIGNGDMFTLLAKEQGSSETPQAQEGEIPEHVKAWARGDDLHPNDGINALAKQLADALAKGGGK